jgi:hypothetical protein
MFDEEEENQKRIGRSDTCQRQVRSGETAHGKVRTRRSMEAIRCANHAGISSSHQEGAVSCANGIMPSPTTKQKQNQKNDQSSCM